MTDPEVERIAELCWRAFARDHETVDWLAEVMNHDVYARPRSSDWRAVALAVLADRAAHPSVPVTDGPTLAEVARERDEALDRVDAAMRLVEVTRGEHDLLRDQVRQEQQNQDDYLKDHIAEVTRLRALAANGAPGPADDRRVFVIFDGPPSHESGRFVEVEDENGRGVNAGEWTHRLDGLWSLGPFYVRAQGPPVTDGPTLMDVVRERDRYAGALAACGVVARYGTRAVRPEYACDSLTAVSNLRTERDALRARLAEVERDRWGEHDAAERHFRQRDDAIRERDEALDRVDAAMRLVEVTRAEHDALAAAMPSDGADAALAYAAIRSEYDAYRKRTEEHMEREEKAVDLLTAERNSARRELDDAKRLLDGVTAARDTLQSRLDTLAARELTEDERDKLVPTLVSWTQGTCNTFQVWDAVRNTLLTAAQEFGEEGRACPSTHKPTAVADQRTPAPAPTFDAELERIINQHNMENASNTPDFILTHFLLSALTAWNAGIQQREEWYGRDALLTAQEPGEEGRAGVTIPPAPAAAAADQRAPTLRWTTTPPTVPGWYYWRWRGHVHVEYYDATAIVECQDDDDSEWAGPIPEPEEVE